MITLSIDEKDPHLLRVSASYLLALAATPQLTPEIANAVANVHNAVVDATVANPAVFNATELAEAEALAKPIDFAAELAKVTLPDAAEVFGAGKSAAYTVAADPLLTAPEVTAVNISTPIPPAVPLPPAVNNENMANPAVHPTGSPVISVDVDARGLPWDARIHSREKTKLTNGNWKNKRGVNADVVASVEAELGRLMTIPLAPAAIASPPVANVPRPPVDSTTAPTVNHSNGTFPGLMQKVTAAIAARQLTNDQVLVIIKQNGFDSLPGLISRPDMIPQVEAMIDAQIAAGG